MEDVLEESGLDWCGTCLHVSGDVFLCSCVCYPGGRAARIWIAQRADFRIVAEAPGAFVATVPITLTVLSVVLFPAFLFWERRQENLGKTCIMPMFVWKNRSFASVCIAVFLAWAAFNGVQYFITLTYLTRSQTFWGIANVVGSKKFSIFQ